MISIYEIQFLIKPIVNRRMTHMNRLSRQYAFDPKTFPIDAICLHPTCKQSRLCSTEIEHNLLYQNYRQHERCRTWVNSLSFLKGENDGLGMEGQRLSTDYFDDPIGSIYFVEKYFGEWEINLVAYFNEVKERIDKQLLETFNRTRNAVANHMLQNKSAYHKVQSFCKSLLMSAPNSKEPFPKDLGEELGRMQLTGRMTLLDQNSLHQKAEDVIREVRSLQSAVWSREPNYDIQQRLECDLKRDELLSFAATASTQVIHDKLQELQRAFRTQLQPLKVENDLQIGCLLCPFVSSSRELLTRHRKTNCRAGLLQHMYAEHTEQIMCKLGRVCAVRLDLEQFRVEVVAKRPKKVVVVDKENVNNFNWGYLPIDPDVYYIEVLSQNSQHLARTRYIMAQSKGRDAADIMVVIVLSELSRLKVREAQLFTKDHFGATLLPILAQMGVRVTVCTRPTIA